VEKKKIANAATETNNSIDKLNNVQKVTFDNPTLGIYRISIVARETDGNDPTFALVVTGALANIPLAPEKFNSRNE